MKKQVIRVIPVYLFFLRSKNYFVFDELNIYGSNGTYIVFLEYFERNFPKKGYLEDLEVYLKKYVIDFCAVDSTDIFHRLVTNFGLYNN
jgi:hypothetical protein